MVVVIGVIIVDPMKATRFVIRRAASMLIQTVYRRSNQHPPRLIHLLDLLALLNLLRQLQLQHINLQQKSRYSIDNFKDCRDPQQRP